MAFVLVGTPVFAQEVDCDNALTQSAMNICADKRYKQADAELNAAWKPAMAYMKETDSYQPEGQKGAADTLLAAQRAWIKYRDLACEAEGWNFHGGSLEPFIVLSCLEDLTRARTERLKDIVLEN